MAGYEDEDGRPRYGRRLSPEELAAYRRAQGVEPGDAPRQERRPPVAARTGRDRAPAPRYPAAPIGPSGRGRPPVRRRWRLLAAGLVVMLVLPVLMLAGAVGLVLDGSPTSGAPLGEGGTVYLEEGTSWALYSSSLSDSVEQCTIADPLGGGVELTAAADGVSYVSFTAATTGLYTVTCPSGTEGVVVGPPMDMSQVTKASALLLGAVLAGLIGLILTVIGALRMRRPRDPHGWAGPPGPPGQFGPPA